MSIASRSCGSMPLLSPEAKLYSGELRRSFHEIYDGRTGPERRLELFLRHSNYPINEAERAEALDVLKGLPLNQDMNVFTITYQLANIASLKAFANAIRLGFNFKDRSTKRWSLVYAIVCKLNAGCIVAEVGCTEKSASALLNRFRSQRITTNNTRLGRFLADVAELPCFLIELECAQGDLEYIGYVKEKWKLAGLRESVIFPQRPYKDRGTDQDFAKRKWPVFDTVVEFGLLI